MFYAIFCEDWLLADPVLGDAPVINSTRLFFGKRVVKARIVPAALSIPRYEMDFLLWQAAVRAGVCAHSSCEVRDITGKGPFVVTTASAEIPPNA